MHLTDLDWEVLQKYLLKPDAADENPQTRAAKNHLLDVLCAMNPPPAGFADTLIRIYRNHEQNDALRDYAVQHLAAYYEQVAGQPNSAHDLEVVQQVLWEAVKERGGSIRGTALLALKRLSQQYAAAFDQSQVATTALQMAADNFSGEATHITAYQVCAQLKVADSLPILLQAAEKGESISVRMSAIGSLGLLGGPEQIPYLESVVNGAEERLKPAARHALEQIKARNNNRLASQNLNFSNP
jgi:HEAT repeat protein